MDERAKQYIINAPVDIVQTAWQYVPTNFWPYRHYFTATVPAVGKKASYMLQMNGCHVDLDIQGQRRDCIITDFQHRCEEPLTRVNGYYDSPSMEA